jgi:hypothetical protein
MPSPERGDSMTTKKWVALTDIRHGVNAEEVKEFRRGETVTGLPKETMETLRDTGAIGVQEELPERREAPEGASELEQELKAELQKRDTKIAELTAEVADLKAKAASTKPASNR